MKRLFTFLLALASVANSYAGIWIDSLSYLLNTNTHQAIVARGESAYRQYTEINIPASVTYNNSTYVVVEIEPWTFAGCSLLEKVTIPQSVRTIGKYAFNDDSLLVQINIPSGLKEIKEATFYGCTRLPSLVLPNGLDSIEGYAFYNCSSLRDVNIPSTVKKIGLRAFYGCSSLTSLDVPSGVSAIMTSTFENCHALKTITLPDNVSSIGERAFFRCYALDSLTLPADLMYIGSWAFYLCENLSSIVIPDNTFVIDQFAFYDCYRLKSVKLGNNLTALPLRSFSGCWELESIDIPDNVTSLGEGVFENCYKLRSARLSSALTEIPENAFYYCRNLDSVSLPSGITSIGKWAFAYCDSLHVITIPQALTSIHAEAFKNTKEIYDVTINSPQLFNVEGGIASIFGKQVKRYALGDAFTTIADEAFNGCDDLQEIVIGPNVTTIGKRAFANLPNLRTIILPDAITAIDEGTFANCSSLESITIGPNITSIAADAFTGCPNLKTIVINSPAIFNQKFKNEYNNEYSIKNVFGEQVTTYVIGDSITTINAYTFLNCTNLTNVTIGKNVEAIDHHAFYGCSALTTITIPEKISSISYQVFQESGLTSVHWNAIDCAFSSGYYSLFHGLAAPLDTIYLGPKVEAIPSKMYDGMTMSAYTLPAHIKRIGLAAFQNCNNLSAIYISDLKAWCELEGIGELLLIPYNNQPARDLYLNGQLIQGDFVVPANITKINPYAFYHYPYITSVTIPDNVVASIGEYAFTCPNITFVSVGSGVTDMYGAFKECPLLTTVTTNTSAHTDDNSGVHMVDIFGSQVTEYTLGENVAQIGRRMFQGATSLRSVTMSEGVTKIGQEAFEGCTGLQTMTIADHVTKIEENAFSGCTGLTEVTIGDGVDTIEERAFMNCTNLRKFTFGKNIKEMEVTLFNKCTKLDTVVWNVAHFPDFENGTSTIFYYKPGNTAYVDLRDKIVSFTLGEEVEYIPAFLCNQMTKLNTIAFPQSVDSIGRSAFSGCTGLTKLQIGKGVKYLGQYAFSSCSNMTEVDIPSSVKTIEGGTFENCSKLTAIYEHATTPPAMNSWAFNSTPNSKVLYVPKKSVNTYKNANPWYNFDYIEPMPADREEGIEQITNDQSPITNKFIHNGQLYIRRGDKLFTPTGQQVK